MSVHILTTTDSKGRKVEVRAGWDRPLQGFFMTVVSVGWEPEEADRVTVDSYEDTIYCNLDDPGLLPDRGMAPSLEAFEPALRKLGLELPAAMIAQIEKDGADNVGNHVQHWSPQGTQA